MKSRDRLPDEDEYYESDEGVTYRVIGKVISKDREYLAVRAFRRDGSEVTTLQDNAIETIIGVDPETNEWCSIECEIMH